MPIGYTPNYFSQYVVKDKRKPAATASRVSGGLPNFAALAAAGSSPAARTRGGALAGSRAAGFSRLAAQAAAKTAKTAKRAASGGVAPAASRAAAGSTLDRWRQAQAPSIANLERYADSIASDGSPTYGIAARTAAGYAPPRASSIPEYFAAIQPAIRGTSMQRYASGMVSPYALPGARTTAGPPNYAQLAAERSGARADTGQGEFSTGLPNYAELAETYGPRNYARPPEATGAFSGELPPNMGGLPPGFGEDPTADLASLQQLFPDLGYSDLVDAYLQYITTRGQAGRGAIDSAFEDRGVYESSDRDFAVDFFDQLLELEKNQGVAAIRGTGTAPSTFTAPSGLSLIHI